MDSTQRFAYFGAVSSIDSKIHAVSLSYVNSRSSKKLLLSLLNGVGSILSYRLQFSWDMQGIAVTNLAYPWLPSEHRGLCGDEGKPAARQRHPAGNRDRAALGVR
jgi:hypothetical protein